MVQNTIVKTEDYIREVVTIFFAQKQIILRTFLIITAFSFAVALFWPPTYSIVGEILIKGKKIEKSPEALESTQIRIPELTKADLASEMEIIASHDVIENTARLLQREKAMFTDIELTSENLRKIVRQVQSNLDAEIKPDSNIIEISFTSKDPAEGRTLLHHLMMEYVNWRGNIFSPSQTITFYETQVDRFAKQLKAQEDELIALAQTYRSPDPAKEIDNNLAIKKDLEQQLDLQRTQWTEKELYVEYLEDALDSKEMQFFSSIDNPSITLLGEKLQNLIIERGNVLRLYHPTSDKVNAVNEQVSRVFDTLHSEVAAYTENIRNEADTLGDTISNMETRLRELSTRNVELHTYLVESERIKRDINLIRHSYDTFSKRLEETRIQASSDANALFSISIISWPYFTNEPVFPRKSVVIPLGIFVAILTGCSLGFLREFFDHTFKKPEDGPKFAGVPTILTIPKWQ